MVKTSVYLDDEQKHDLERVVELTGRSQADLIRDGINQVIQDHLAKRPKMKARFHNAAAVGKTEDLLEGFGE
jgi:Arc/MetJ-type ribon-helix-helix transcriptional regulator